MDCAVFRCISEMLCCVRDGGGLLVRFASCQVLTQPHSFPSAWEQGVGTDYVLARRYKSKMARKVQTAGKAAPKPKAKDSPKAKRQVSPFGTALSFDLPGAEFVFGLVAPVGTDTS